MVKWLRWMQSIRRDGMKWSCVSENYLWLWCLVWLSAAFSLSNANSSCTRKQNEKKDWNDFNVTQRLRIISPFSNFKCIKIHCGVCTASAAIRKTSFPSFSAQRFHIAIEITIYLILYYFYSFDRFDSVSFLSRFSEFEPYFVLFFFTTFASLIPLTTIRFHIWLLVWDPSFLLLAGCLWCICDSDQNYQQWL